MIVQAHKEVLPALAKLAEELWPDQTSNELEQELAQVMESKTAVFFMAYHQDIAVGFAQCQLRHDYVEGTAGSPVGYLEGIYIREAYRGRGYAAALLRRCEAWATAMGCKEFASDCTLDNEASCRFHMKTGFREAGRIICFVKNL